VFLREMECLSLETKKKADMIFLKNWWKTDGMDSRNITLVLVIQSKHKCHLTRWSVLQHIQNNWREILLQTHPSITPHSRVRCGEHLSSSFKTSLKLLCQQLSSQQFYSLKCYWFLFFYFIFIFLQHIVYCHLHQQKQVGFPLFIAIYR